MPAALDSCVTIAVMGAYFGPKCKEMSDVGVQVDDPELVTPLARSKLPRDSMTRDRIA